MAGPGGERPWARLAQWRLLASDRGPDFLATWSAWRQDPLRPRLLHYAAITAHPLSLDELQSAAQALPHGGELLAQLGPQWQGFVPGFHRLAFEGGRVLLTLCVGDAAAMLRELRLQADAAVLAADEGASWDLPTLKVLTRLCRREATLRAADAALAHDLATCGWQVETRSADGGLVARYAPSWEVRRRAETPARTPGECIVVGAGLAGAAAAASLARRGWSVSVVDRAPQPAAGASSLPAGLLAPHQSPDDNLLSRLSRAGVRITLQEARARLAAGIEWEATGVLEWRGDDHRPLPPLGDGLLPWSREADASRKAAGGIAPGTAAWWHENAGWIEPAAFVRSWLREPGVRFTAGREVARIVREGSDWRLEDAQGEAIAQAPLVVVAAALASAPLLQERLALRPVRGQVSWAPHGDDAANLPSFPVNGHGHFLPRVPLVERQAWITGSTYGRGDADASLRNEDVAANLQRVEEALPRAAAVMRGAAARGELRSWSGVRCTSSDRRPLVGEIEEGLWASTAMGSRGLTFAALCGELLAAQLHQEPLPLEARLAQALDARRQLAGT